MADATLIFALGAFVFFQLSRSRGDENYEKTRRKRLTGGPPAWIFPVAWLVIYTFITTSAYFAFTEVTENFTAMICVFFVNIMLNKYWSVLFFDYEAPMAALFVLLGMIGTSGAFLYFVFISPKAFYMHLFPYVPWCLVALWWNIQSLPSEKKDEDAPIDTDYGGNRRSVLPISIKGRLKGTPPPFLVPPKVSGRPLINI